MGYPPRIGQQVEYLVRCGRYASCIHAGELSCVVLFSGNLNLALNKVALQSSGVDGGRAEHAVDGNRDGDFRRKSCSLTSTQNVPWWVVDLGDEYEITHVASINRADEAGKICRGCFRMVWDRDGRGDLKNHSYLEYEQFLQIVIQMQIIRRFLVHSDTDYRPIESPVSHFCRI